MAIDEIGMKASVPSVRSERGGAPIAVALDQQDAEVANLIDEVHILIEKIRPVCGPEYPVPTDPSNEMDSPETSDVASRINNTSRNVTNLRRNVRAVRDRIEL